MKFSENWLRSHVPVSAGRDELVATLTAIGLEVEEVTPLGDSLRDLQAAVAAGANPILVRTGKGAATEAEGKLPEGTIVFDDLAVF